MNLIKKNTIKKNIRKFKGTDTQVKFPLGGIGTGSVSVGSRGQLEDWEIFNNPNKNAIYPYSFFSLYGKFDGEKPITKNLEAQLNPPYDRPIGYSSFEMAGIPRFSSSEIYGQGPFVNVKLSDDKLPLEVNMQAFSPFIPTDEENSGIPAIDFVYGVKNLSDKPCDVSVCATQSNFTSYEGFDLFGNLIVNDNLKNEFFDNGYSRGIKMSSDAPQNSRRFGTMCLVTTNEHYTVKPSWLEGGWWDGAHDFFNEFSLNGKLSAKSEPIVAPDDALAFVWKLRTGSIAASERILPGETKEFHFILSWHFPNRPKSWQGHICPARDFGDETVKNHYAYRFSDAYAVSDYFIRHRTELYTSSKAFADALFSTTLDKWAVDAVNGTLAVLRSTTCFRIGAEGTFLAWEGCFDNRGSCEGNCTHVWNYAQTLAYLFPRLEQNMRRTEFLLETDDEGYMAFRTMQTLGDKKWDMLPATDGQLGCVVRLYRDWKFSGNDKLLKECYPKMKSALNFAFSYWDSDCDCVLDSRQHNTYDIEFFGPNSLSNSMFFAALKAGVEMANFVGDDVSEKRWREAYISGSKKMDDMLFKNGYYVQILDDVDNYKHQYGDGCLSDQILGQTLAHLCGLGYVLPQEHVKEAIYNVYKNNFCNDFYSHLNVQRVYSLNDDKGLLVCSWPKGTKRPRIPFIYADEVWSGIEYQVATELIYEGFQREGLTIVKAVRERYDGKRRNPFNEVECGNHYARSLASYGVLLALNGFKYDMKQKTIWFVDSDCPYTTFFTTVSCFGLCRISNGSFAVQVLYGSLGDIKIKLYRGND